MHSPQAGLCAGCVPASGFPGNGENTLLGPERASGSRFNPPRPPGTPPGRGFSLDADSERYPDLTLLSSVRYQLG